MGGLEEEGDCGPGGATTNGPDATPPQLSVKTCGGGGGGGSAGGWGVLAARPAGGGVRATYYYHMYTSRACVCVCLGTWGYRGMYPMIEIFPSSVLAPGHTNNGCGLWLHIPCRLRIPPPYKTGVKNPFVEPTPPSPAQSG